MADKITLSEELEWRGFNYQTTYHKGDLSSLDNKPLTFYWGVDPSSDSMTVGNLAIAMMVKTFIRHGCKAYLLVGGATGLIGDPDGKSDERVLQSPQSISRNARLIAAQYDNLFGKGNFKKVNNNQWFRGKRYIHFLRDIGKHVPMREMLGREFVESRITDQTKGLSYAEFSYALIQAYDFYYLYRQHGVTLQVCGSDQWGNSIAGVNLIRRKLGKEANIVAAPLMVNTSTGKKFGKSEEGAVWLDPRKTTPTRFYQFWINTGDDSLEQYLKIFTELDRAAVKDTLANHHRNPGHRYGQRVLAHQVTALVHGQEKAGLAEEITDILTNHTALEAANKRAIEAMKKEIGHAKAKPGTDLVKALVASGLAASNSEAFRLLKSNAVYVNGKPATRHTIEKGDFRAGRLLLRRGKAFKDSALVELA